MSLESIYKQRSETLIAETAKRDTLLEERSKKEQELEKSKMDLQLKEISRTLLQKTSEEAREKARVVLESTVTTALQHVFGSQFSANIKTDVSSGKPVADIYIVTDNGPNAKKTECKPEEACGGGIVDIVSIALRIAMVQLNQEPKINGPLIFDEPGKFVSADFSIKLAEFLRYISKAFNKQIIFVTHNQDLKSVSDICYVARITDGTTAVKAIDPRTGADL